MSTYAFLIWLFLSPADAANGPVVVHFTAPWCASCQKMKPTIKSLRTLGYDIRTVDVTKNEALAKRYGVEELPATVIVHHGKIKDRTLGLISRKDLEIFLRKHHPEKSPPRIVEPVTTISRAAFVDGNFQKATQSRWISVNRAGAPSLTQVLPNSPGRQLLKATVRIELRDDSGVSFGSGTIIHAQNNRALIATCGHLFRGMPMTQPISVDVFYPQGEKRVQGRILISDADKYDVALMIIPYQGEITPIALDLDTQPARGQRVFTAGCNHGNKPTLQRSQVNSINRYDGPENIQTQGAPVGGRSGGGLVNQDGKLIGICNAADLEDDEGFYVSAKYIQLMMQRLGIADLVAP